MNTYLIISSFIVILASLSGVLFTTKKLSSVVERNLHFLVSFSAGVMLIVTFGLMRESLEHDKIIGLIWILVGCLSTWMILKLFPESHHHHEKGESHKHNHIDARKIVLADTIHNIGDGILIATSFSINTTFGFITTLGVIVHEVLAEISEFFVMKEAGWDNKKAIRINLLSATSVLIGVFGAHTLLSLSEHMDVVLLGIAGGVLLSVLLQDLIPHSIRSGKENLSCLKKHIVWFLLGALIMFLATNLFSHEHEHGHEDEHTEVHTDHLETEGQN